METINGLKVRKNLISEKFGRLVVSDLNGKNKKGNALWKCKCKCGNECVVRQDLLTSGKTKSCGCLRKLPKGESSFNALYLRYKNQAKERDLIFKVEKEDFRLLTKKDCYYCGLEPQQEQNAKCHNGGYVYNGIDRLDNSIGYISNNIVACCKTCNRSKHALDINQFQKWVKRAYIHLYRKVTEKTPGELIDSLITVDIKCFMFQEKSLDENLTDDERLKFADLVIAMNKKRCNLMRSIDVLLDFDEDMVTPKTYLQDVDDNLDAEF